MASWPILFDILILLGAALLLGTLAESIGQSAILGYLVAGTVVGPNVLGFVKDAENVAAISELGVALLLFTIGLEFSFRRLARLGRVAIPGGTVQVVLTTLCAAAVAVGLGVEPRAAIALGAMVAMSSTACVLRLLVDRRELDTMHGRNAMGILLVQDVAVIPLMLLVVVLAQGGNAADAALMLARTVLLAAGLVAGFVLVFNVIVPRILHIEQWARNRELPILLAIVLALGSAYAAHQVSLSPAIGAFVAGVLLGESPFATQVRADVGSLRTLLVTLFFASIGMLGDPAWALGHWAIVGAAVAMIMAGKLLLVWLTLRLLGATHGIAVATGLCLVQVGEFSFVLADQARRTALFSVDLFDVIVSATIVTLFLTPFCLMAAPRAADAIEALRVRLRRKPGEPVAEQAGPGPAPPQGIFIIGFGPAGQSVAQALYGAHKDRMAIIELNPRRAAPARQWELRVHLGDATHRDVLEHAGIAGAQVVAITIPDPAAVRTIIHLCRHLAPSAAIVARSRYHVRRWELELAGARDVIDEEEQVGLRIAATARRYLSPEPPEPGPDRPQSEQP